MFRNYGIGILVGGDGKPMATSPTMLETLEREIKESTKGVYLNSAAVQENGALVVCEILFWRDVTACITMTYRSGDFGAFVYFMER